ncbi:hypothetical protein B0H14DRAFT_3582500 [Mycena olivaceomarginata]|nr:hypothetical protein B0H14DRAFT_3582500 [Mycena olivaceomarginata]
MVYGTAKSVPAPRKKVATKNSTQDSQFGDAAPPEKAVKAEESNSEDAAPPKKRAKAFPAPRKKIATKNVRSFGPSTFSNSEDAAPPKKPAKATPAPWKKIATRKTEESDSEDAAPPKKSAKSVPAPRKKIATRKTEESDSDDAALPPRKLRKKVTTRKPLASAPVMRRLWLSDVAVEGNNIKWDRGDWDNFSWLSGTILTAEGPMALENWEKKKKSSYALEWSKSVQKNFGPLNAGSDPFATYTQTSLG